jgi:hypothetical protein
MKIIVNVVFCFFIGVMGMFSANTNTLSSQAHAAAIKAKPSGISAIAGLWKDTDHVHQGCRSRTSACKAYKVDLMFKSASGGKLRADMVGRYKAQKFYMIGSLKPTIGKPGWKTWSFKTYMTGKYAGYGSFDFSPDFRSFEGVQWNIDSTHHVVWTGKKDS